MPPRDYYLPERRLVSQEDASMIESPQYPRSRFSGSWTRKTAFNAGHLIPFLVDEILPGDHMSYEATAYIRMATPLFPIFDNQRIDTFFFFVPCRLLWDNWAKFCGEQEAPGDPNDFTIPQVVSDPGGFGEFDIYDHFGLPIAGQIDPAQVLSVNALPFRAYNLIYNEWFRDQNIMAKLIVEKGDGPDSSGNYGIVARAKSHDYFTSALPFPQKFDAPTVPVSGLAPVLGIGFDPLAGGFTLAASPQLRQSDGSTTAYNPHSLVTDANEFYFRGQEIGGAGYPDVVADLTQATGVAINTLRQAWLVQSLLERDARGGTRYVEQLRQHFGVISPDFRIQRPEYIGGGQTPLNITPIAQTAPSAGVPVGALGAAGTAAGQHRASYAATEHGYVIGLMNVRTELSYQQGLHKMWSRQTRFDFYWPALANLGEQAILRKEIYCTGDPLNDDVVFGYQERWHEYRTRQSEVTGVLRSGSTGTLDAWHLAQTFATPPLLNSVFLTDTPPMERVLAAGLQAFDQQYLADIMIQRSATRPLPMYGTPVQLGRF